MPEPLRVPDPVVLHPADVLRAVSKPVGKIDGSMLDLGARLRAAMAAAGGIGLAAPQIGISRRAVAIGFKTPRGIEAVVMFDPEIRWKSGTLTSMDEGCLSIPGRRFRVLRPDEVEVAYTNLDGRSVVARVGGLAAKCVQHEIDHLDGVLILNRGDEVERPGALAPGEGANV